MGVGLSWLMDDYYTLLARLVGYDFQYFWAFFKIWIENEKKYNGLNCHQLPPSLRCESWWSGHWAPDCDEVYLHEIKFIF
jgi:hypothetical protein